MRSKRPKILFIDSDIDLCSIALDYFIDRGYEFETAHDGAGGLAAVLRSAPDLVIVATDTPGLDSLELLYCLRRERAVGLIMLAEGCTARDRIGGLDAGADDCLSKPFVLEELAARIRAIVRRVAWSNARLSREEISVGNLRLNPRTRQAWVNESCRDLTRLEFEILALLARSVGRAVSRSRMVTILCHSRVVCRERTIYTTVSNLRAKLGSEVRPAIRTVRGSGYLLPAAD